MGKYFDERMRDISNAQESFEREEQKFDERTGICSECPYIPCTIFTTGICYFVDDEC